VGRTAVYYVKGAVDKVMKMSRFVYSNGTAAPMSAAKQTEIFDRASYDFFHLFRFS
jgi:hypothetical protein